MGAVGVVVARRSRRHWRGLVVAGVLLGLGFGLCWSSVAAARRTGSAYERILEASEAPDAAINLGTPARKSERSLRAVESIVDQRVYLGFVGTAVGVDRL